MTSGFKNCGSESSAVQLERANIEYNNDDGTLTFDLAGTSEISQQVMAALEIVAYGISVYTKSFNPCDNDTFVESLCPVPLGAFTATGTQTVPAAFTQQIPSIAFTMPDIEAYALLTLQTTEGSEELACIQTDITNGKTVSVAAVSYVAASVAGVALVASGVGAVSAAAAGGGHAAAGGLTATMPSPNFGDVCGWFQGMAMGGMLSVDYPSVYRKFAKNFGFSMGLLQWNSMQVSIDNFREATGGNLTDNSMAALLGTTVSGESAVRKRMLLLGRSNDTESTDSVQTVISGIKEYVEELSIPSGNTFMTILLVVATVVASIVVGILLVKVVLELWALNRQIPPALEEFRSNYWATIARTLTTLILLLYGVWVMYCMYQFTRGDSWAAKLLAALTLILVTGVLALFCYQIGSTAKKLQEARGDASGLYDDKQLWDKYSLFYESYRQQYWWAFVPALVYTMVKSLTLALGDGHGMAQTVVQLIIELAMLGLLVWSKPYERRSGNIINIAMQVVRVLSVICIFVFIEELGIAATTQTVMGVVLIVVQSGLTGILMLLIVWNAAIACFKENPHQRRLRELEQARDRDNLTPLYARNSLLMFSSRNPEKEGSGAAAPGYSLEMRPSSRASSAGSTTLRDSTGSTAGDPFNKQHNSLSPSSAAVTKPPRMSLPKRLSTLSKRSSVQQAAHATAGPGGGAEGLLDHAAPAGRSERAPSIQSRGSVASGVSAWERRATALAEARQSPEPRSPGLAKY